MRARRPEDRSRGVIPTKGLGVRGSPTDRESVTPLSQMSARLRALALPRSGPDDERERAQVAFAVMVAWLAVLVAAVTSLVAASSAPLTASATAICGGVFVAVGVGLKLGMRGRVAFRAVFATTWLLFVVSALGETGPDLALVAWCAIFPLATTLFEGPRAGVGAFALSLACVAAMFGAAALDLPRSEPSGALTGLRMASLMITAFLLSLAGARMRDAALEEARRAAQARTYFLASMSHEFRTPMNGVIGLAEAMLERPRSVEDHESLRLIKRSGRQLLSLIDDVIDVARLDSGRLAIKPEATELRALVEESVELVRASQPDKGVVVRVDIPSEVPSWVQLDPLRTRQVLTNLTANALKFTHTGEVVIALSVDAPVGSSPTLVLVVRDTGVGIPADAMARLFSPFEQAHRARKNQPGSGLGLAITRQLVTLMGGTVELASTVGEGTRATIRLPLELASPRPATIEAPQAKASGAAPQRAVLVVDDNEINLRVALALVRRAGYRAYAAIDGREAIEAVRERDFDFVLMDCHMPEMDGFEATRHIRALGGGRGRVPIIAVTASALAEEHEACLAAGMDACTTKPLTLDALEKVFATARSDRPGSTAPQRLG